MRIFCFIALLIFSLNVYADENIEYCAKLSQPWKDTEARIDNGSFNIKNKCNFPITVTWCVLNHPSTDYSCGKAFGGYRFTASGGGDAEYSFHATNSKAGPLKFLRYRVCRGELYAVRRDGSYFDGGGSKCVSDPGFGLDRCPGGFNCWRHRH